MVVSHPSFQCPEKKLIMKKNKNRLLEQQYKKLLLILYANKLITSKTGMDVDNSKYTVLASYTYIITSIFHAKKLIIT